MRAASVMRFSVSLAPMLRALLGDQDEGVGEALSWFAPNQVAEYDGA